MFTIRELGKSTHSRNFELGFSWRSKQGASIAMRQSRWPMLVIESEMMEPDSDLPDRLLSAIGDFRQEMLHWIDSELDRLREREQAEARRNEQGPASAPLAHFGATSRRHLSTSGWLHHPPAAASSEHHRLELASDRDPVPENARQLPDAPRPAPDAEPPATDSNARQRLDALARLLDSRLKQSQAEAGTRNGAGSDRGVGVANDPPESFRREGRE
jgi:hypothetical protein